MGMGVYRHQWSMTTRLIDHVLISTLRSIKAMNVRYGVIDLFYSRHGINILPPHEHID